MALSKSYLSVNGELYAEWTEGSKTEVGYIRDALGNVMETVNGDGTTLNTYNYKPFGDVLSKTGSAPDPKYLWCGTWGYRANGAKWISHYVRARHYSFADAAWTSVDPLWPSEMAYGYVENRVMTGVDYWGMKPTNQKLGRLAGDVSCSKQWNAYIFNYCNQCYHPGSSFIDPLCRVNCDQMARAYYRKCGKTSYGPGNFQPPYSNPGVVAPHHQPSGPYYNPGWNPISFKYGNCCGQQLKCSCDDIGTGRALDCLDRACARHDDCLGGTLQSVLSGLGPCDLQLAIDLSACNCKEMYTHVVDIENCESAKFRMLYGFYAVGKMGSSLKGRASGTINGWIQWGDEPKVTWPFYLE